MKFFWNLDNGAVTLGIEDTGSLAYSVPIKGGQDVPLEVQFHRNKVLCPLPAGASAFLFGCKPVVNGKGKFEGTYLTSAGTWTVPAWGTGAEYLVNHAGGYSPGATALTLDTGTGTILAGDVLTIGATNYTVSGALASNVVTIAAPGLIVAAADNAAVTVNINTGPITAILHTDTTPIRTALVIDGDGGVNDLGAITDTVCELQFLAAGASHPTKSQTFSLSIQNWVNQGGEGSAADPSPGNSKYYGTNDTGVKGYYALPSGGGSGPAYHAVANAAARYAFSPTPHVGDIIEQTDTHRRWMACNVADLGRDNGWQDLGQKPSTRLLFAEDGSHSIDISTWSITGGTFIHEAPGSDEYAYIDTPEYVTAIAITDGSIQAPVDCSACVELTSLNLAGAQFNTPPNITGLTALSMVNISYTPITDASALDDFFIALNAAATAGNVMGGSVNTTGTVAPTSDSDSARGNLSGALGWSVMIDF